MNFIGIADWIAKNLFDWLFLMMKLSSTIPYRPEQKDGTDESIELGYDEIRRKSMAHVCSIYF